MSFFQRSLFVFLAQVVGSFVDIFFSRPIDPPSSRKDRESLQVRAQRRNKNEIKNEIKREGERVARSNHLSLVHTSLLTRLRFLNIDGEEKERAAKKSERERKQEKKLFQLYDHPIFVLRFTLNTGRNPRSFSRTQHM